MNMVGSTTAHGHAGTTGPLAGTGVGNPLSVHANLTAPQLTHHAVRRGEARFSEDGALIVRTGVHTGRSVADKFVVDEPETTADINWGAINQRIDPAHFATLKRRVQAYLQGRDLFTQDLYAGADPSPPHSRAPGLHQPVARPVRAQHVHPPAGARPARLRPDYVILHAPEFQADPDIDGVKSSTAIALSFAQKMIVIAGTEYAGEIKKSIFTVMNWQLPARGLLSMHCSANIGPQGDTALFFGLSGTGKTTLSSDPAQKTDRRRRAWLGAGRRVQR